MRRCSRSLSLALPELSYGLGGGLAREIQDDETNRVRRAQRNNDDPNIASTLGALLRTCSQDRPNTLSLDERRMLRANARR